MTYFQSRQRLPLFVTCLGLIALCSCASNEPLDTTAPDDASFADTEETIEETAIQNDAAPSSNTTEQPVTSQTNPSDSEPANTSVDLEIGITYAKARTRLIQQGWTPLEAPEPGQFGAERTLYDAGFTEVSACSGTGLGPCQFSFYHPNRAEGVNALSVTTHGGDKPEIAAWSLDAYDVVASAAESSPEVAEQSLSEIPVAFRGTWDISPEQGCSGLSDGRLIIESNRLQFYGGAGPVLAVAKQKTDSIIMVRSELSDEGMTDVRTHTFSLSSDGSSLTDLQTGSVRRRCPNG